MFLNRLLLINYRNYEYQELALHPRMNLFLGENAQGKTNLLESVYLSARGRSFKNVRDRDIIRFGKRSAYVRADIDRNGSEKIVEIKLSMVERKRVRINEIEVENLKELSYLFDVVLFSPEDLAIVQDSPEYRRNYLDDLITGIEPSYAQRLAEYDKILYQRNRLLKGRRDRWFDDQLQALDRQLAASARGIVSRRARLSAEIAEEGREIHRLLSDSGEDFCLRYQTNSAGAEEAPEDGDELERRMLEALEESRDRDIERGNTDIGPHKDDLLLNLDGIPARKFASQGQSRTATITLKLCEMRILERYNRSKPVLLLDDVFSELDEKRRGFLLEAILPYQTILTSNSFEGPLPGGEEGCVRRIVRGQVSGGGRIG